MTRAALLATLLAACGGSERPAPFVKPHPPATLAARLPQRQDLVCFPCHSHVKFESGPFPHGKSFHRAAGHCHVCHVGAGHEGRSIDRTACLKCHEDGSEQLRILATSDTSRN